MNTAHSKTCSFVTELSQESSAILYDTIRSLTRKIKPHTCQDEERKQRRRKVQGEEEPDDIDYVNQACTPGYPEHVMLFSPANKIRLS